MTAKVNHPAAGSPDDYGDQAHGVISGTTTSVDGKSVNYAVLLDPATGLPALPSATLGTGPITLADGADVAQGASTDAAGAASVIGQLKAITANTTGSAATASNTYTGAGNGTRVNAITDPVGSYSLQVKGTGTAATHWNVVLEVSLDGTNYTTALTHSDTGGNTDGQTIHITDFPALYFRSRCVSLSLGPATNIVATVLGKS